MIKIILGRLAQQEHRLVRLRAAIRHALRHRIGLGPDDLLAQIPAVGAQSESEHPWNAYEVFGFKASLSLSSSNGIAMEFLCVFAACRSSPLPIVGVAISDVQP